MLKRFGGFIKWLWDGKQFPFCPTLDRNDLLIVSATSLMSGYIAAGRHLEQGQALGQAIRLLDEIENREKPRRSLSGYRDV